MSDAKTDTAEPKKKGGFMKKALIAIVLLGVGGGGTYGAFAMGMLGNAAHAEEDDTPKLVLKGEEDPYPFGAAEGEKDKVEFVPGKGGSKYRTAYYNFTDEFTSNLAGGTALVQVSIAASTNYDGRVLMWLQEHETALARVGRTGRHRRDEPDRGARQGRAAKALGQGDE